MAQALMSLVPLRTVALVGGSATILGVLRGAIHSLTEEAAFVGSKAVLEVLRSQIEPVWEPFDTLGRYLLVCYSIFQLRQELVDLLQVILRLTLAESVFDLDWQQVRCTSNTSFKKRKVKPGRLFPMSCDG